MVFINYSSDSLWGRKGACSSVSLEALVFKFCKHFSSSDRSTHPVQ